MNATTISHSARTRSVPDARDTTPMWRRLVGRTAIVVRWIAWQLERRRARRALLQLSDEQLKDIGLSRSQTDVLVSWRPD